MWTHLSQPIRVLRNRLTHDGVEAVPIWQLFSSFSSVSACTLRPAVVTSRSNEEYTLTLATFLSLFVVAARIMQYWRIDGETGAADILNRSLSRSHSPWPRTQEWIENMLLLKVRRKTQAMRRLMRGEILTLTCCCLSTECFRGFKGRRQ